MAWDIRRRRGSPLAADTLPDKYAITNNASVSDWQTNQLHASGKSRTDRDLGMLNGKPYWMTRRQV